MTLFELVNSMSIQGNVKLSVLNDDCTEISSVILCNVSDLAYYSAVKEYEDYEATYFYSDLIDSAPFLVIELKEKE